MERHFHKELDKLKEDLLKMALLTKSAIEKSVKALLDQDLELADTVIKEDRVIDRIEIEIDDKAHNLLALCQPVAVDMRLLTMILRINNDLERIGDHAVNIAERVTLIKADGVISKVCPISELCPIKEMGKLATRVLIEAVEAFLKSDAEAAQKLLQKDDEIDSLNDRTYQTLEQRMKKEPDKTTTCMALILIAHNLERIGDLSNNIAEDVIYIVKGKEVRHHTADQTLRSN